MKSIGDWISTYSIRAQDKQMPLDYRLEVYCFLAGMGVPRGFPNIQKTPKNT